MGRQAAAVGIEAAKPQPLGQAAQGLVHQEFHGLANPPGSQLSRDAGFWFFLVFCKGLRLHFPQEKNLVGRPFLATQPKAITAACPANIKKDVDRLLRELNHRYPGRRRQSQISRTQGRVEA